ncbi:MAG: type II toxin-antitoxin system RelE family toxin [Bacteroidales bacterium]
MKYAIVYKKSAAEELLRLPQGMAYKVKTAIDNLAGNPRPPRCSKLKGSVSDYRIRVGNYRIIYTIADTLLIITIIKIAHRKSAYR